MFKIEGVRKHFGRQAVLQDISLSFSPGSVTALVGANGSGKSTLLKICVGLLRADSGKILAGERPLTKVPAFELAYMGHAPMLYTRFSVRENLEFFASLVSTQSDAPRADVTQVMAHWEVQDIAHRTPQGLSQGQLARISLCRALMHHPKYIFLDEPSAALDDAGTAILQRELKGRGEQGAAIVVATHDLQRLGELPAHKVRLEGGRAI